MIILRLLFSFILIPCVCFGSPGDTLYVQGNAVNMREGPSTNAKVIMKLNKGHKLLEISSSGEWIEVGAHRTGGKTGWIHSSLVDKQFIGRTTKAIETPEYIKFKAAFNQLNKNIKQNNGKTFFTKSEYLGDGIVQVTATDYWLSSPYTDRENKLRIIFNNWDTVEGTGLPIAVHVVDSRGEMKMWMNREKEFVFHQLSTP